MPISDLERQILQMGALAERILERSIRAVRERDLPLAEAVDLDDLEIDRLEVTLDAGILRALALQAPVAEDLRRVMAIKAMAVDLERVGDLARNIARAAVRLAERPTTEFPARLEPLEREACDMLRHALDAFQAVDPVAARAVIAGDDRADALKDEIVSELIAAFGRAPELAAQAVDAILIAENLERVADHATNVAEDVILVAEARNVKHAEKLHS
jgi:phosphate transport system protein